jgi:hypothetical protein
MPDVIDHLKSSERLMAAREPASILAIGPKTIYGYAAQHDSTFQDRAECPLPWMRYH